MSDLIRRKDVLHILANHYWGDYADVCSEAANEILDLPTVATDEVIAYRCPECHMISVLYDYKNEHFCPNCGIERKF